MVAYIMKHIDKGMRVGSIIPGFPVDTSSDPVVGPAPKTHREGGRGPRSTERGQVSYQCRRGDHRNCYKLDCPCPCNHEEICIEETK